MPEKTTYKHSRAAAKKAHAENHCAVEGCKDAYRAKGYCEFHYGAWRRGLFGKDRYNTCSKADCKKRVEFNKHGLCETHYQEWWKQRHPDAAA